MSGVNEGNSFVFAAAAPPAAAIAAAESPSDESPAPPRGEANGETGIAPADAAEAAEDSCWGDCMGDCNGEGPPLELFGETGEGRTLGVLSGFT